MKTLAIDPLSKLPNVNQKGLDVQKNQSKTSLEERITPMGS